MTSNGKQAVRHSDQSLTKLEGNLKDMIRMSEDRDAEQIAIYKVRADAIIVLREV